MANSNSPSRKDIEGKILDILEKEVMSMSQLAKELDTSRYHLAGYLEALKNQGKLEFHKVGKSNVYTIRGKWRGRL